MVNEAKGTHQNTLIVDGYNVIFRTPELRGLVEQSLEHAREILIRKIKRYLMAKHVSVIVIFDGTQPPVGVENPPRSNRLSIRFSRNPFKADPLIKDTIRRHPRPKAITLVTDDSDIVRYAKAHQAKVMKSADFFQLLEKRWRQDSHAKADDPQLTDEELAEWLKLFGAEDSEK